MKSYVSALLIAISLILCSCGDQNDSTSTTEPSPSRFTDNQNGSILDNETGLLWQKTADDNLKNYSDSERYCADLSLGNNTDWRVPTINELLTLSDDSLTQPTENEGFTPIENMTTIGYWSSTPNVGEPSYVWYLALQQWFHSYYYHVDSPGPAIRCVQGSELIQDNQFVDNLDGTVTDNSTNLMWKQHQYSEQDAVDFDLKLRDWSDSSAYCENLTFAGKGDWRLPKIKELLTLVNYNKYSPAMDPSFFPNLSTCCSDYWSSTTVPEDNLSAWTVHMGDHGYIDSKPKVDYFNYSMCVRNIK